MQPPPESTPWSGLPARLEDLAGAMRAVDEAVAARAAELSELADRALDRARELEHALAEALAAARDAREALTRAAPGADFAGRADPPPPPRATPAPDASLEEARLVAIEMAVAGRSRADVHAHLRAAFSPPDTEALLDDVFGQSSRRRAGSL